jgi:peptidoglycan/xylan/chitin deacetylase (PgdA/CDA1 family)
VADIVRALGLAIGLTIGLTMSLEIGLSPSGVGVGVAVAAAFAGPIEIHSRLAPASLGPSLTPASARVALTFDACSGRFDADLIDLLVRHRVPATLFVTERWLAANPQGTELLKTHADLFSIQNHGARHVPAVIGPGRSVYGIAGHADVAHLRLEVQGGAEAIARRFGTIPRWYRAATAMYDRESLAEIDRLGLGVAGFTVNADAGATLARTSIADRLRRVRDGDVVLAHMNHPEGHTAEALADVLPGLIRQGIVFVRLDQASLEVVPGLGALATPKRGFSAAGAPPPR